MESSSEIIRKLTKLEVIYDNELHHGNLICTRAFLVDLAGKAVITLPLLKQACAYWAKHNPLLSAEIRRNPMNETDRFFVKMNESDLLPMNNVDIEETDHFIRSA